MKFNATLCSTDGNEPWAANIDFILSSGELTTKLKATYAHYKNIVNNSNVVIAYKDSDLEILMKATATIDTLEGDKATARIRPTWLRLVENDNTRDMSDLREIIDTLEQRIAA